MNQVVKALLVSLGIIFGVSFFVGLSMYFMFNWRIGVGIFILSIIAQIAFGIFNNSRREEKQVEKYEKTLKEMLESASKIETIMSLNCSYCSTANTVPISLARDNSFKCGSCNNPNSVFINYTVARITQPYATPIEKIDKVSSAALENFVDGKG